MEAPRYTFSPESVQTLREHHGKPVRLGDFAAAPGISGATSITLRAALMKSPYGNYADYIKEALRQEFEESRRFRPDAEVEVSGIILKNDVNANGFIRGEATLTVRTLVKREGAVTYDKTLSAEQTWDSNFVGAIAIPRAAAAYPALVQRFVDILVQDPDFIAAIY